MYFSIRQGLAYHIYVNYLTLNRISLTHTQHITHTDDKYTYIDKSALEIFVSFLL